MRLVLKAKGVVRVLARHPWLFRGHAAGFPEAPSGELLAFGDRRHVLGWGFWNPGASLCCRVLAWTEARPVLEELLRKRFAAARRRRRIWCAGEDAYRLISGEGDGLPGLVVDVYGPVAVVQMLSAGWHRNKGLLLDVLRESLAPEAVVLRNDVRVAEREGFPRERCVLEGTLSEDAVIPVRYGDLLAGVRPLGGQKTGAYLDVRAFPRLLHGLAPGARVLDAFCYQGAFGLHALSFGAAEVVALDQSEEALAAAEEDRLRNGLPDRLRRMCGNAFEVLRNLERAGERFDVAVVDPPPFAPGKNQIEAARRGYKELALRTLKMLTPGGTLFFFSCSAAFSGEMLRATLDDAARDAGRELCILAELRQGADHPVLAQVPETGYLKGFVLEVTP